MFEVFKTYTHRNMLDAAIVVLHSHKDHNGDYSLRVRWITRSGRDLGETDIIRVQSNKVRSWYAIKIEIAA